MIVITDPDHIVYAIALIEGLTNWKSMDYHVYDVSSDSLPDVGTYYNPDEEIGTTGPLVDFLNENLTEEEWKAIAVVHNLKNRLDMGIRFDWSKSIDVKTVNASQIIDESVFLNR